MTKTTKTFKIRSVELLALGFVLCALSAASIRAQDSDDNTKKTDSPPTTVAEPDSMTKATAEAPTADAKNADSDAPALETDEKPPQRRGRGEETIFNFGHSVELKQGETADVVVVMGGDVKIHGKVRDAAVVIWGNLEVDGEIDDAAVVVMGNIKANKGSHLRGDVVTVGGKVEAEEGARLDQRPQVIDFPDGLKGWFTHCFLMMRPLAPQVGWVWAVAGVFFVLYLFIAILFQRPVQVCLGEITNRPATTFLLGLLAKLLVPLVLLILAVTGLGLVVIPFLLAALFFGVLVGKVAILEALGVKLGKQLGVDLLPKPVVAFLLGSLLIVVVYMVPVLGLLTFAVLSLWGLGVAVTAAFGGFRRELPEREAPKAMAFAPVNAPVGTPAEALGAGFASSSFGAPGNPVAPASPGASAPSESSPPVIVPDVLAYPRAGFWERMGAALLDTILVTVLAVFVHGPPLGFLVALAYFAGMWAWKGTTIGGIVLGLKVARLDGREVTFAVALVRALAGAFSIFVLFLGILWAAWDKEKQGWHDKIAGTVVLKLPRGTPLVCF